VSQDTHWDAYRPVQYCIAGFDLFDK
jgi:hypothetical protein